MKISFLGSGGVGCTTAFTSGINSNICNEIVMFDILEDFSKGKAMDLQQGFILNNKNIIVKGTNNYKDLTGSDAIVITAGIAKSDGSVSRESLLSKNKEIMSDIANKLKDVILSGDNQPLIIMVTNPVDVILKHFIDVGNFNKKKTIGSGNLLDTARFKYYLAKQLNIEENTIQTITIGQHGAKMVYLLSQTKINDEPLFDYIKRNNIKPEILEECCKKSTNGSAEIMTLIGKGETFYGPALSIYKILESYFNNDKKLIPVSVYTNGEYGFNDCCIGLPVIIGKNGVEEIKILDITENEKNELIEANNFINQL
ncbi:MAG: hypothetical protein PHY80_01045 [Rickettsiales bacterium]|nr:hypothetical protein [Rickettsiales bacterium]